MLCPGPALEHLLLAKEAVRGWVLGLGLSMSRRPGFGPSMTQQFPGPPSHLHPASQSVRGDLSPASASALYPGRRSCRAAAGLVDPGPLA